VSDGAETGARAGARNTVATVNFKQRSVGGTQYVVVVSVEKAVGHPVEFEAGMGAAIAIEVEFTVLAYGENTVKFIELKTLCTVDRDVVDGAKQLRVSFFRRQI